MRILVFYIMLLIGFTGTAQKGAKIQFDHPDNTLDYGVVKKGTDNGIRNVTFTNKGDAPLEITSVQSTSGVTILSKPSVAIAPGKTEKIEIKYNMVPGPIRKTITIETNATNYANGRVAVKIKGDVEP